MRDTLTSLRKQATSVSSAPVSFARPPVGSQSSSAGWSGSDCGIFLADLIAKDGLSAALQAIPTLPITTHKPCDADTISSSQSPPITTVIELNVDELIQLALIALDL